MQVMHPDGETRVFMAEQTPIFGAILARYESFNLQYVKIGRIGGEGLMFGGLEWKAFVELVNEIDKEFDK